MMATFTIMRSSMTAKETRVRVWRVEFGVSRCSHITASGSGAACTVHEVSRGTRSRSTAADSQRDSLLSVDHDMRSLAPPIWAASTDDHAVVILESTRVDHGGRSYRARNLARHDVLSKLMIACPVVACSSSPSACGSSRARTSSLHSTCRGGAQARRRIHPITVPIPGASFI
eukprot:scaffold31546_cov66-Phaeocystis_antarctica.AAC.15